MKKILLLLLVLAVVYTACKDDDPEYALGTRTLELSSPVDSIELTGILTTLKWDVSFEGNELGQTNFAKDKASFLYNVYVSDSRGGISAGNVFKEEGLTGTSVDVTGLHYNGIYYWQVVCLSGGEKLESEAAVFRAKEVKNFLSSEAYQVSEGLVSGIGRAETLDSLNKKLIKTVPGLFVWLKADKQTPASSIQEVSYLQFMVDDGSVKEYSLEVDKSNNTDVSSDLYVVGKDQISNIPNGEVLADFKKNISVYEGASFEVYQADGITVATDVQTGYQLIVTAEDGTTKTTYTLSVNKSTLAGVTSTAYTVSGSEISGIPYGESLSDFKANVTAAAGASFEVYQADGTTAATDLQTGYKLIVTAEDGTTKTTYSLSVNKSNLAGVTSTAYTVSSSEISGIPYGESLSDFKANVTAAAGASFEVYQADGTTAATDLQTGYQLIVTAEDGTTKTTYSLSVNKSNLASVTSTAYTVSSSEISGIPYGESLSDFKANVTAAAGASFEVYQADGTTAATDLQTGYKLIVTAEDGTTKTTYSLSVNKSNLAGVTSTAYTVSSSEISGIPYGESLSDFKANVTAAAGASFEVYQADGTTAATDLQTGYQLIVTAEDGTTKTTYSLSVNKSNLASVTSTAYTVSSSEISGIPYGESLSDFKANVTAAAGASFEVYQADGTTAATDLQTGYKLIVTAEDGTTKTTYSLSVNKSNLASVTSTAYTVSSSEISGIPYGESLSDFKANVTAAAGAAFEVYQADGTTAATDLQTGYKLIVTAEDGTTKTTYDITVASGVTTVTSAAGRIWMDRNLGAEQVATSSTDDLAYGDLYQWGRGADGHEKRNSGTTNIQSDSDTPGHGDFIIGSIDIRNWRSTPNDNLWDGVNGVNNPCPAGFRLPTKAEWQAESDSWVSQNSAGAFSSSLKLPVAASRNTDGEMENAGIGFYWCSDATNNVVNYMVLTQALVIMRTYDVPIFGMSVRCIKD
ncbi:hypothetical protein [Labilibaculum euxinus]